MKKYRTGSKSIIFKAVCLLLAVISGGSVFATGAMASAGCGMKCCCPLQTVPADKHHNSEMQVRSSSGCCSGLPLNACDLQAAPPYRLPEVVPAACCGPHQAASGPAVIPGDNFIGSRNSSGYFLFQQLHQVFTPPPLYLQNHSYLI